MAAGDMLTDCRPAGYRLRRHRVALGTSPLPLAYAMGAEGGSRQAVAICGFLSAPNIQTSLRAGVWGLTPD